MATDSGRYTDIVQSIVNDNYIVEHSNTPRKSTYELVKTYMPAKFDYDNYIIAHHITVNQGTLVLPKSYRIPGYPQQVSDSMSATYQNVEILARSAPIYSWARSGPRTLTFQLSVHKDMDWEGSGYDLTKVGDISELMEEYQALTLPNYEDAYRVEAPKLTIRIGNSIRITGIPQEISFTAALPLDPYGSYMAGTFSFTINEINPYEAKEVVTSLHNARGLSRDQL